MMRREFQMIVLVLLGILCVNIATAQDVRQKPVVKKQPAPATTTKKQSAATTSKKQPMSTAKKKSTPTTKAKSAVKDEK